MEQIFRISEIEKRTGILTKAVPTELSEEERGDVIRILASRAKDPFLPDVKQYFNDFVERAGFRQLNQFGRVCPIATLEDLSRGSPIH